MSMKTISQEVPTFGKIWANINTTSHDGFCRAHLGEFSIWATLLLMVGAMVRWLPGLRASPQKSRESQVDALIAG